MNSKNSHDLPALLADPALAQEVAVEAIPPLLVQLAAEHAQLSAVERVLLARLVAEADRNGRHEDQLLNIEQAAARLATSRDWIRRHVGDLPFVVRLSDGQVRYSSKGIERFIASRMRF